MQNITLQQLVNQKTRQKSLSPRQLVSKLGYTNVSKGCRRLKEYLTSLHPPSEEFVVNLLTVLEINGLEYSRAVLCTQAEFDSEAQRCFKPYIQLKNEVKITPLFARALLFRKYCIQHVPERIQTLPFNEEIEFVGSAYREQYNRFLSDMNPRLARKTINEGFRYYRQYGSYLEFNSDAVLISMSNLQNAPSTKQPLVGNRVLNIVAGGM